MKRIITTAVLTLLAGLGTAAIAEPAHAANYCNSSATKPTQYWDEAGGFYLVTTAPVYGGSVDCLMNRGATGAGVRALQSALNSCYNAGLVVDGILGDKTTTAIENVQRAAGITVDGGWGPQTRGVLRFRTSQDAHGRTYCSPLK